MSSREIVFEVEELSDGGYVARAVGESIFVEGDSLESLRANVIDVIDAINCHFEPDKKPEFLQLQWADAGLTADQMAELDRRIEDSRNNPDAAIPWEEVREKLLHLTRQKD